MSLSLSIPFAESWLREADYCKPAKSYDVNLTLQRADTPDNATDDDCEQQSGRHFIKLGVRRLMTAFTFA